MNQYTPFDFTLNFFALMRAHIIIMIDRTNLIRKTPSLEDAQTSKGKHQHKAGGGGRG
jgi:hypothetical protein